MDKEEGSIRYLNLDIELESLQDLTPLVEYLGEEILVLCNEQVDDVFYTILEPRYFEPEEQTPDNHARHILGLLEKLPDQLQEMWNGCRTKLFDFGFDSGFAPCPFFSDLTPDILARIAAIDATVRTTIYPAELAPDPSDGGQKSSS